MNLNLKYLLMQKNRNDFIRDFKNSNGYTPDVDMLDDKIQEIVYIVDEDFDNDEFVNYMYELKDYICFLEEKISGNNS